MRRRLRFTKWSLLIGLMALLLGACAPAGPKVEKKAKAEHPALSPQEKLVACSDCHRTETPEIYEEWFKSRHGIAMVKCFQCHGTFETFHAPTRETCRICHAKAYENCPSDRVCWACHNEHLFKKHVKK